MHVRVATPAFGGMVNVQFAACLLQLQLECYRQKTNLSFDIVGNESLVQRARNLMVARFLAGDADKLFFVDSDITFDPSGFFRVLGSDKHAVAAAYAKKYINWEKVRQGVLCGSGEPVHSMGLDYNVNIHGSRQESDPKDGLIPVLDAATGFMCLSRPLLERLCQEYKPTEVVNDIMSSPGAQKVNKYVPIFDCMRDPDTGRALSEDYSLCRRIQQVGEQMWVDPRVPLGHMGNMDYTGDAAAAFRVLQKQKNGAESYGGSSSSAVRSTEETAGRLV